MTHADAKRLYADLYDQYRRTRKHLGDDLVWVMHPQTVRTLMEMFQALMPHVGITSDTVLGTLFGCPILQDDAVAPDHVTLGSGEQWRLERARRMARPSLN